MKREDAVKKALLLVVAAALEFARYGGPRDYAMIEASLRKLREAAGLDRKGRDRAEGLEL
jgi:hypothetical protein